MVEGAVEGAAKGAGNALTHKIGPLPVWAWGVGIAVVGGGIYLLLTNASSGTPGTSSLGGQLNALGQGVTGGLGLGGNPIGTTVPTSTPTPATTPVATLTNAQWLQGVLSSVAQQTGQPIGNIENYLTDFLNGTLPQGNNAAASEAQRAIQAALQAGGQPPNPPSQISSNNPFQDNQQGWLSSILANLPAGTPGSVQTELTNLVNGLSSNLSQQAATALQDAENLVGGPPSSLSYTIGTPSAGAAPSTPAPSIQLSDLTSWTSNYLAAIKTKGNNINDWLNTAPAAVTSSLNGSQLTTLYNWLHAASVPGGRIYNNEALALQTINSYLANPNQNLGATS